MGRLLCWLAEGEHDDDGTKLEQRVAALEHQLAQLKAGSARKPMSESRGLRLIRQAEESHADLLAASQK